MTMSRASDALRVWDVSPGYLRRDELLRELHALGVITALISDTHGGAALDPEAVRWLGFERALAVRDRQCRCESALRGLEAAPPPWVDVGVIRWPDTGIHGAAQQLESLRPTDGPDTGGRIPVPRNAQQLWSHHKYSMLARDPQEYREIGAAVAGHSIPFDDLARVLTEILRVRPDEGGIRNAVQHMWGYVSAHAARNGSVIGTWSLRQLLAETQRLAMLHAVAYLTASTALAELMVWLPAD